MLLLTRKMGFSASHRLWRPDWDAARNRDVFGATAGPLPHGHDYALEVTLRGAADPETGMLMDLRRLKDVMDAEIGSRFDHRDLNDDGELFRDRPPTAENLARVIFDLLDAALPAGLLASVHLEPVADLAVEVSR